MLTNRPVFPIPDMTGLEGKYVYIIRKCIESNPNNRYQSIKELADDFQLLTQRQFNIESPSELAQKIVGEIIDPFLETVESKGVEELIKIFLDNDDNLEIFIDILPKIPEEIINKMVEIQPHSFIQIIQIYDQKVEGNLRFSYCDTVAGFYQKVFWLLDDFNFRRLILNRLLEMGFSHNRWYVRDVFAHILEQILEIGLVRLALDVLRNNPRASQWISVGVNFDKIHPLLIEGLREINQPPEDEEFEIPF